jgi:cytochrome oxidase assembly protein ShyY1
VALFRLAFTRRWLGILALTVAFALACIALGQWQFARRTEAQAAIAVLDSNYSQPALPVAAVLNSPTNADRSLKWTPVRLTGRYLADRVVYVRTRIGEGGIGFEQLVPFLDDSGTVLVIDRGWVAADGANTNPVEPPAIPNVSVTVVARLMPTEQTIPGRDAPAGQIATIHVPSIAGRLNNPTFEAWYGRVDSETPATVTGARWEEPILDEGPHLSYALQWYVFALMGFIGYGWALRQEARGPIEPTNTGPRSPRQRDEDFEDAALDARSA